MQLCALDGSLPISASQAKAGKNYSCPECGLPVRIRSGPSRRVHYYHLKVSKNCRLHKKSLEHLQMQLKILALLGNNEAQIECPFSEIGRIADVAWHTKRIVFEVQCSPISSEEAKNRILDYQKVGYTVVWILHDKQFNKTHLSASENHLRKSPCYYTNIDKIGGGIVYDQFEVLKKGRRLFKGPPLPITPTKISLIPSVTPPEGIFPHILLERLSQWRCFAQGDLLHRLLREGNLSLSAKKMTDIESLYNKEKTLAKRLPLRALLAKTYLFILDGLLKGLLT